MENDINIYDIYEFCKDQDIEIIENDSAYNLIIKKTISFIEIEVLTEMLGINMSQLFLINEENRCYISIPKEDMKSDFDLLKQKIYGKYNMGSYPDDY